MEKHKNKILTILIVAIFLILTLAILLPKFPIFVVKRVFNYAVQNFVNISGLSPWLIKGILVFALMPFYWALMEISKLNLHLFRRQRSYRKLAKFTIFSYAGLFFLAMFFLSRGSYFGHIKGEAIKYYAITPEGIRFFDSPGFDRRYGIELKPVTPDIIIKYQKKTLGMQPRRIMIESPKDFEFFDPITGDPKAWYHIDNEGHYEFFDGPGYHPTLNAELKPVTPEIIHAYQNKIKEEQEKIAAEKERLAEEQKKKIEAEKAQQLIAYLGKYLNLSVTNHPATKEISIFILDETFKERHDIEQTVASSLKTKELNPVLALFKNPFVQDGIFENMFSGDIGKIKELQLEKRTDYIILGKKSSSYKINPELQNIITADVSLELKVFSVEKGVIINSTILSAAGAGFSNSDAEKRAIELLNSKIENFLKEVF